MYNGLATNSLIIFVARRHQGSSDMQRQRQRREHGLDSLDLDPSQPGGATRDSNIHVRRECYRILEFEANVVFLY